MGAARTDSDGALKTAVLRTLGGKERVRRLLRSVGYDTTHWTRIAAYRDATAWIRSLGLGRLHVLEIVGGEYWRTLPFASYMEVQYPAFDICKDVLDQKFDLVIADQVFEHIRSPLAAVRNVRAMLNPGGHFLVVVPFLLKLHCYPDDCTRWSESGLRHLLVDAGFADQSIRTSSWGNRDCAIANLRHGWRMYGWGRNMRNEPDFPVMTWALARASFSHATPLRGVAPH